MGSPGRPVGWEALAPTPVGVNPVLRLCVCVRVLGGLGAGGREMQGAGEGLSWKGHMWRPHGFPGATGPWSSGDRRFSWVELVGRGKV